MQEKVHEYKGYTLKGIPYNSKEMRWFIYKNEIKVKRLPVKTLKDAKQVIDNSFKD